jgi:TonB-linked SusC/RagA family outer membrane protein
MKEKLPNPIPFSSSGIKKILLTMKIALTIIFLNVLSVSANVYSETNVNLDVHNMSIRDVTKAIEQQSQIHFFYNDDLLAMNNLVDVKADNKNVIGVLDDIFSNTELTYKTYENNLIVIESRELIQQKRITGTVVDETGNPLPGVNIQVEGTTFGAISDMSGRYTIETPNDNVTLIFSFIGYENQRITTTGRTTVNVSMVPSLASLEEVVVIGYGTKVKSTVTGSISSVGGEEIKAFAASTNIIDVLQANVSGAFVLAQNGQPGAVSNIYLRGPVSVNGGNPLYVVDGIPMDNMGYKFNPDDIESISVLKDASAAAIYGAKAAGGVILVTTKRGAQSPLRISVNASTGIRNALYLPEVLNRDQFLAARKAFGTDVVDLYGPESGWSSLPDVSWLDEVTRTGVEQNYGISLRGGNENNSYFLSGGYNRVDGVVIDNWISRYTLRLNSDHQITKKLKFNLGTFFKYGIEDPIDGSGGMGAAFRQQPTMAVYDPTATDNRGFAKVVKGFQGNNRVQQLVDRADINKDYSLDLNGTLSYNIIDGLKASIFGATSMLWQDQYQYVYPFNNGAFIGLPSIYAQQQKRQDYIVTYTLNYNKTFGVHSISALGGYEARKQERALVQYNNSTTLVHEAKHSDLVQSATNATGVFWVNDVDDRILSQFGRVEYTYDGKYLFTGNIRRDGYGSKFSSKYKYGVFPGASLGWVISRENFMKQFSSVIQLLKFRGGYGMLGNAVGTDFAYSSFYESGYAQDWGKGKLSGIRLSSQFANEEIRWETVATTNIGLDGVLWRGILSFSFDYYSRQTKDMLYNIPIALSSGVGTLSSGVATVQANVGQMSNKGWELNLDHKNNFGDFAINIGVNLGSNKNKLISLSDEIDRLFIASGQTAYGGESGAGFYGNIYPNRSEPGKPLGQFYGLQTSGIYQTDAEASEGPRINISSVQYNPVAGDLAYVDQNNDGKITTADYVYIGNPWPKLTYGLTLGASWKKMIDIKAIFSGTLGNDILNIVESYEHNFQSDYTSSMKIWECSFFGDNGLTAKPRNATLSRPDNNGNWRFMSDYHIKKGNYIQLKTLTIGFTLPRSITSRINVSNAKLTFSGENLFILTKYDGLTPVIAPQNRNILAQGIDTPSGRYPLSRLLSAGLNIDF